MTERAETKIKICGLSRAEDICYVNEARPDYCGFVIGVPKSRRNVTEEQLRRLRIGLQEGITPVGVFVNADPRLVAKLLEEGLIDAAQLHGGENEEYIRKLREMTDWILLDQGKGGTGKPFDWEILERWLFKHDPSKPYFLAGGLSCDNIPEAVQRCRPWAVDLSSSVETDGKKDREKILAAVAAVRSRRI